MSIDTSDGHPAMDYEQHVRTFNAFWLFTKIAIITVAVVLIALAYFLL